MSDTLTERIKNGSGEGLAGRILKSIERNVGPTMEQAPVDIWYYGNLLFTIEVRELLALAAKEQRT